MHRAVQLSPLSHSKAFSSPSQGTPDPPAGTPHPTLCYLSRWAPFTRHEVRGSSSLSSSVSVSITRWWVPRWLPLSDGCGRGCRERVHTPWFESLFLFILGRCLRVGLLGLCASGFNLWRELLLSAGRKLLGWGGLGAWSLPLTTLQAGLTRWHPPSLTTLGRAGTPGLGLARSSEGNLCESPGEDPEPSLFLTFDCPPVHRLGPPLGEAGARGLSSAHVLGFERSLLKIHLVQEGWSASGWFPGLQCCQVIPGHK